MKSKLIGLFVGMLVFVGIVYSEITRETLTPVYQGRTLNAFTVYIVGGSTTTTGTYAVSNTSIAFVTAGGLYPGTTYFLLNQYTLDELITELNALDTTVPGAEGGIVAVRVQGAWGDNPCTNLAIMSATNCLGSSNVKTASFTATQGISYILPSDDLAPGQQYHLTDASFNVTYASTGTCYVDIYDGTTTTTKLRRELYKVSGVDAKLDISPNGEFAGSANTAMRIDIWSDAYITAGWINISGYKK